MAEVSEGKTPRTGILGLADRAIARFGTAIVVLTFLATVTTLILGIRELLDLHGPGWAIVLAVFTVLLTTAAVTVVYVEQGRRRTEISGVREQHATERDRLVEHYESELDRFRRDARVALALPDVHRAFEELREAQALLSDGEAGPPFTGRLMASLRAMTQAFSVIVGAPCRMSVKELIADESAPDEMDWPGDVRWFTVRTLYRNEAPTDPTKDDPSPLSENTDFKRIWDPFDTALGRCFFSNDLDTDPPDYHNPHRPRGAPDPEYNASIVWPIQRRLESPKVDLIGYLCVDTQAKGVFRHGNDFHLGAAYADTLFWVLSARADH